MEKFIDYLQHQWNRLMYKLTFRNYKNKQSCRALLKKIENLKKARVTKKYTK